MGLSINKLEKIIAEQGMLIKNIYTISELCVYIELINLHSAETVFIYIPSKYEITTNNYNNVYPLHYLEISEDGCIPSDYTADINEDELEDNYNEINIENRNTMKENDIEEYLETKYNCPISLKDSSKEDLNEIKEIFRQLKRLRFCVQNLDYKLCIMYKCYLCCMRRDATYECYSVENFNINNQRRIIVTIDLESMYENINTLNKDIFKVRKGIYKILDKNQTKHISNLETLIEHKANINNLSLNVTTQKDKYKKYLKKLENMLVNLCEAEKNIILKIRQIEEKYKAENITKTLYNDIERTNLISFQEKELKKLNETKQEILSNILSVKTNLESLSLKIDQICFDNIVMLDMVIKNFNSLDKI
jgi:hypothetical protein